MSPVWTAVGKYILSLFVKRKSSDSKEGLQMAITCNEQRRQRWTNGLKKEIKKKEENIFLKKSSGLKIKIKKKKTGTVVGRGHNCSSAGV
jgi:hypothetical protein